MVFIVEYKYSFVRLPASTTVKVLHLAKKENYRLTVAQAKLPDVSRSYSEQAYQVRSATEVHVGRSRVRSSHYLEVDW